MMGRIRSTFCLLALLALGLVAARADDSAGAPPADILVLRNGETMQGTVSRQDDRFVLTLTDGEIRLPARDVDFLCHSLQEAYEVQSKRISGTRIEDRLHLADWCIRHEVAGGAAQEITAAMAIDPKDPRLEVLDRRLQAMLNEPQAAAADDKSQVHEAVAGANSSGAESIAEKNGRPALPANADELERLARNLPPGTLERYSTTILPLLLNHCATAGCHAVGSSSAFVLLRPTSGSAVAWRMTLRDLHNTLDRVDYESPANSKLLSAAREAHGTCTAAAFEEEESREYQQLVQWVLLATQGDKLPRSAKSPANVSGSRIPKTVAFPRRDPAVIPAAASDPLSSGPPLPRGAISAKPPTAPAAPVLNNSSAAAVQWPPAAAMPTKALKMPQPIAPATESAPPATQPPAATQTAAAAPDPDAALPIPPSP